MYDTLFLAYRDWGRVGDRYNICVSTALPGPPVPQALE